MSLYIFFRAWYPIYMNEASIVDNFIGLTSGVVMLFMSIFYLPKTDKKVQSYALMISGAFIIGLYVYLNKGLPYSFDLMIGIILLIGGISEYYGYSIGKK